MTGLELPEEVLGPGPALDDALVRFIDESKIGIALRAPVIVPPGSNRGIPVAGCRVETLREAARRPTFENMAVIVATQLETGCVRVARAFAHTANAAAPRLSDPGEGYTGSVFRLDAARLLGIPLMPGAIALWLVARERAAGPIRVLVASPSPPGIEDPEVVKFLAAWRKRHTAKPRGADPATVWPEQAVFAAFPTYRKTADSPPIPESGILLVAEPAIIHEKGAAWILAGSFRLAIPRRRIVFECVSGDPTTAVVPITLVISGSEVAVSMVRHLRVPSFSAIDPNDTTPVVEGRFTLNLFSFFTWRAPQTYFVRAVSGDTLSEPVVTRLELR